MWKISSPPARWTVSESIVAREIKCPSCRKKTSWEDNPHRPFCSERCRLIDLGAWAQERYRIPAEEIDVSVEDDEDAEKKPIN
jgi:endogenous inhibitor of DNA gyrase (YacG/DUF329 family)